MTLSIIFGILGAFILLESLFLIIFPLTSKNILKEISKSKKTIKKVGITEFFLGLILLAISYLIKLG